MVNIAPTNLALVHSLWQKLNATILTTYLHGASGPAGEVHARLVPSCIDVFG